MRGDRILIVDDEPLNLQVFDYKDKPARQMCRLHLSMMDKMGLRPSTFGDAKSPLEEV